ncbi:MAG: Flp pilus assembly protein CpaB [Chloroflexota bacterium]
MLIVGLLFAVGAGATTFFIANTAKSEAPAPIPTSSIIVAAREIPPKTQITTSDLKLVKMNTEVVPPAALTKAEDVIGRITITSISVGEPILASKLGGANGQVFVVIPAAALGTDGGILAGSAHYRAMSLTIPDANAAGGNIQPGDIIDVLFSFTFDPVKYLVNPNPTRNGPDVSARIVLERVPVLARTAAIYTIRTDAATSERIAYLQASGGVLQFILRGPKDDRATGTTGATFRTVYPEVKIQVPEKITP